MTDDYTPDLLGDLALARQEIASLRAQLAEERAFAPDATALREALADLVDMVQAELNMHHLTCDFKRRVLPKALALLRSEPRGEK